MSLDNAVSLLRTGMPDTAAAHGRAGRRDEDDAFARIVHGGRQGHRAENGKAVRHDDAPARPVSERAEPKPGEAEPQSKAPAVFSEPPLADEGALVELAKLTGTKPHALSAKASVTDQSDFPETADTQEAGEEKLPDEALQVPGDTALPHPPVPKTMPSADPPPLVDAEPEKKVETDAIKGIEGVESKPAEKPADRKIAPDEPRKPAADAATTIATPAPPLPDAPKVRPVETEVSDKFATGADGGDATPVKKVDAAPAAIRPTVTAVSTTADSATADPAAPAPDPASESASHADTRETTATRSATRDPVPTPVPQQAAPPVFRAELTVAAANYALVGGKTGRDNASTPLDDTAEPSSPALPVKVAASAGGDELPTPFSRLASFEMRARETLERIAAAGEPALPARDMPAARDGLRAVDDRPAKTDRAAPVVPATTAQGIQARVEVAVPAVTLPAASPAATVVSAIATAPAWSAAALSQQQDARAAATTPKSLAIQLNPADLGVVTAHLKLDGDTLTVELQAETHEARDRLSAERDDIARALRGRGFAVDQVTVMQSPIATPTAARPEGTGAQAGFAARDQAAGGNAAGGGQSGTRQEARHGEQAFAQERGVARGAAGSGGDGLYI